LSLTFTPAAPLTPCSLGLLPAVLLVILIALAGRTSGLGLTGRKSKPFCSVAGVAGTDAELLAHTEDVGLACSEAPALWLHDVQILPGRVRCGMSHHEVVRRVLATVVQRQCQRKQVDNVPRAEHQAFLASVDFEHCYSFVAGEDCFNDISLLADIRIW
jgi:hypothetical protein